MIDETINKVVHDFGTGRGIALYEGVYVMVDALPGLGWELSGEPARQGLELETLNGLVKPTEGTTVVVIPPEGT